MPALTNRLCDKVQKVERGVCCQTSKSNGREREATFMIVYWVYKLSQLRSLMEACHVKTLLIVVVILSFAEPWI